MDSVTAAPADWRTSAAVSLCLIQSPLSMTILISKPMVIQVRKEKKTNSKTKRNLTTNPPKKPKPKQAKQNKKETQTTKIRLIFCKVYSWQFIFPLSADFTRKLLETLKDSINVVNTRVILCLHRSFMMWAVSSGKLFQRSSRDVHSVFKTLMFCCIVISKFCLK